MTMHWNGPFIKTVSFVGASAGVIAQSNGDLTDPKTVAAAIAAGCLAVLALSRAPGQAQAEQASIRPTAQVEDEQREARVRQVREAGGRG